MISENFSVFSITRKRNTAWCWSPIWDSPEILHKSGFLSCTQRGQHSWLCFEYSLPNVISCQTHLSLRLTVHGEFPGIPFTIRNLVTGMRSSLFPHSLNSTFSVSTGDHCIITNSSMKAYWHFAYSFFYSQTNLLVLLGTPSLQLFENNNNRLI